MSTYVISDIHGNFETFKRMLDLIRFDYSKDTLIINGDIIDRGKDSYKMIKFVRTFPKVKMLLGNHELMLVDYYESGDKTWFMNGGNITKEDIERNADDINEIIAWIKSLPCIYNTEVNGKKFVIGHGNPFLKDKYDITWDRIIPNEIIPEKDKDDDRIAIIGHTPTIYLDETLKEAKILKNTDEKTFFIDCGAADYQNKRSRLGCLQLDNLKEYYLPLTNL